MYNRYIRNDFGTYTRILEDDGKNRRPQNIMPSPSATDAPPGHPPMNDAPEHPSTDNVPPRNHPPEHPPMDNMPPSNHPPMGNVSHRPPPNASGHSPMGNAPQDGLNGFVRHLLNVSHLEHVETGDLLILVLLFILYREGADEELLVALGLLLIL